MLLASCFWPLFYWTTNNVLLRLSCLTLGCVSLQNFLIALRLHWAQIQGSLCQMQKSTINITLWGFFKLFFLLISFVWLHQSKAYPPITAFYEIQNSLFLVKCTEYFSQKIILITWKDNLPSVWRFIMHIPAFNCLNRQNGTFMHLQIVPKKTEPCKGHTSIQDISSYDFPWCKKACTILVTDWKQSI